MRYFIIKISFLTVSVTAKAFIYFIINQWHISAFAILTCDYSFKKKQQIWLEKYKHWILVYVSLYIYTGEDAKEIVYANPVLLRRCHDFIIFFQWLTDATCLRQAHCCHVFFNLFSFLVSLDVINITTMYIDLHSLFCKWFNFNFCHKLELPLCSDSCWHRAFSWAIY